MVIRSDLQPELKERLRAVLLAIDVNPHVSPTLARFELKRFAPVSYEHYAPEEQTLRECKRLLSNRLFWSDSLLRSSGSAKRI